MSMRRRFRTGSLVAAVTVALALITASAALAVPPALSNLTHAKRHPSAGLVAPRADSVSVYIATRPDRATDGSFLSENVEEFDLLTDQEIQSGSWLLESALDPGTWFVMASASAESSCYSFPPPEYKLVIDPACAHGYSEVMTLTIPKPVSRYRASVTALRSIGIVYLTLRATTLGENRPYRVCWKLKTKKRRCVRGTLSGYDWSSSASDFLRVNARGMDKVTTFVWYVGSKAVASKRIRTK
jgi:hypothetical protein